MSYNYFKERQKWTEWKEKEERLLRQLDVSEDKIAALREYDKLVFNEERRFHRHQNVTDEKFFKKQPYIPTKEIKSIDDLLDTIENEALYEMLRNQDETTLKILLLKVYGYTVKEISEILGINIKTVYYRIKKIRKFKSSLE